MKNCDLGSTTRCFARIKIKIDLTLPVGQGDPVSKLPLRLSSTTRPTHPPRIPIVNRKQVLF